MGWDAIGAIGQAVSALALVFVLFQLRFAREEMRHTARRSRLDATQELWLAQATNPQLASVIQRLWTSTGSPPVQYIEHGMASGLTEGEARQVNAYAFASWQNTQGSIETADLFSPGLREDLNARLRRLYRGNGFQAKWYELSKADLNPDAVRCVDNVLAQPG